MDILAERFHIHSVAGLVYAEAKSTPDFLALLRGTVAVFERTDLKYVWIIPTFTQSGVGKDKPCRFIKGKQTLLVFQNKIVCFRSYFPPK